MLWAHKGERISPRKGIFSRQPQQLQFQIVTDTNHLNNACSADASTCAFSNRVVRRICKHSVIYHKSVAYL